MRFTLLGQVSGESHGVPVPLGRRQERCLLGLLLLELGHPVPIARLADLLWDDAPPVRARPTVHTYVARLRARLAPHKVQLVTDSGGYRLDLPPEQVDLHRFRLLVAGAAGLTDPAARAARLTEALDLWCGPVLGDVASDRLRARLETGYEELRLSAVEQCGHAELAAGRPDRAIAVATGPARHRPVREPLVALLMQAYAAAGRTADALASYRWARNALARDLGLEPGAALRQMHEGLLRGEFVGKTGPADLAHGDPVVLAHGDRVVDDPAARLSTQVGAEALRTSADPLDRRAEELLRWLAVIPLPTLTPDVAAVLAGWVDPLGVTAALDRLVRADLLACADHGRYAMHELVRARLAQAGPAVAARDRHDALRRLLQHYLATAARVHAILLPGREPAGDPPRPDPSDESSMCTAAQANAWLDGELANVVALARLAAGQPGFAGAFPLRVALALHWLLGTRAAWSCEQALAHLARQSLPDNAHPADRIDVLRLCGQAALHAGRLAEARTELEAAAAAARASDESYRLVITLNDLGRVDLLMAGYPTARQRFEYGLTVARAQGWSRIEAVLLLNLSCVDIAQRHWHHALTTLRRSLAIRREIGDSAGLAVALPLIGYVYLELGRTTEALDRLDEAVHACRVAGNDVDGWFAVLTRAAVRLGRADLRPALRDAVAAARLCSPQRPYESAATLRLLSFATARAGRATTSARLRRRADDAYAAYSGARRAEVESVLLHAGSPQPRRVRRSAGAPTPLAVSLAR